MQAIGPDLSSNQQQAAGGRKRRPIVHSQRTSQCPECQKRNRSACLYSIVRRSPDNATLGKKGPRRTVIDFPPPRLELMQRMATASQLSRRPWA